MSRAGERRNATTVRSGLCKQLRFSSRWCVVGERRVLCVFLVYGPLDCEDRRVFLSVIYTRATDQQQVQVGTKCRRLCVIFCLIINQERQRRREFRVCDCSGIARTSSHQTSKAKREIISRVCNIFTRTGLSRSRN